MKGVCRSVALIALTSALVSVAAAQARVKSATRGPERSPLAGAYIPAASGLSCDTRIARASTGKRLSVGLACTASPEPAAPTEERHLLHPGEALIESEPGLYIIAPRSLPETTTSPVTAQPTPAWAVFISN